MNTDWQAAAERAVNDSGLPRLLAAVHPTATPRQIEQAVATLATQVLKAARPYLLAECLADLADEFADEFPELAHGLDKSSHQIREHTR